MACLHKKTFNIVKYDNGGSQICGIDCFHVDDEMAPTIQILNRKGYLTLICCSGVHKSRDNLSTSYILFKKGISLPSLPPGFQIGNWEHKDFASCVGITKVCDTQYEETFKQLYEWALNLPIFIS